MSDLLSRLGRGAVDFGEQIGNRLRYGMSTEEKDAALAAGLPGAPPRTGLGAGLEASDRYGAGYLLAKQWPMLAESVIQPLADAARTVPTWAHFIEGAGDAPELQSYATMGGHEARRQADILRRTGPLSPQAPSPQPSTHYPAAYTTNDQSSALRK